MFGFGFALVPLYNLFCQITGTQSIGQNAAELGTVKTPRENPVSSDRMVTVKFTGTVGDGLPWDFKPLMRKVRVRVGEPTDIKYLARNRADHPVVGQAVPSVAPWQATKHFSKVECFCFSQQTLQAHESREMPLRFVVSPELSDEIDSITLSYTFMNTNQVAERNSEIAAAKPQ
jgi:cytochrome c oxidase assembly protein subunit 11